MMAAFCPFSSCRTVPFALILVCLLLRFFFLFCTDKYGYFMLLTNDNKSNADVNATLASEELPGDEHHCQVKADQ